MDLGKILFNTFFIILYIFILAFIVKAIIAWKKGVYIKSHQYNLTFLQIKLPQQNEVEIGAAEHFFSNITGYRRTFWKALLKGQPQISFEIVSKIDGIGFYVIVPDDLVSLIEKQINAAYPTAEIDIIDPNEVWDRGEITAIAEVKLAGPLYYPIKSYKNMESNDPLSAITSSLSKLEENEVVAIQYIISPASDAWRSAGSAFIGHVRNKNANMEKPANIDPATLEGIERKIALPGFNISVRIVAISGNKKSAESHVKSISTSFEQFTDVSYNRFKLKKPLIKKPLINNFIYRKMKVRNLYIPVFGITLFKNTAVLNVEEMASIFHFPNKNIQTPNIIWLTARKSSAPTNIPSEGLYLGKNIFRGVEKKIFMKTEDRTRHAYIVGQTGTGKSELMKSLAIQDIYNGNGLAFIDPHGSDIDDILLKIPQERIDDVILFNVADTDRPLGLNILEADSDEQKNMVINSFIALLYKLYDPNRQGIMGPKLERAIRNVMLTAMVDPDSTLVDVLRILIDPKYAQSFVERIQDPLVKRYWTDEVAKTTDFHKSETMGYFVSKFDRFVTDKLMRNIIGQPKSAINFNKIMSERKILLVDLSKGKIGEENSNFLGLILVPKILAAALGRAQYLGKQDFPNFYLYVDEFQNFATPDFATILSEARKYKLNLIVAHQFVAQLQEEIKDAVFGNVGTTISFRVGADDAEYLEGQFDPIFNKNDLINIQIGNAYIRLLIDGHPSVPFSLNVDWDSINATQKNEEIAQQTKEHSRQVYGKPVEEVEAYINHRAGFTPEPNQENTKEQAVEGSTKLTNPPIPKKKVIPF